LYLLCFLILYTIGCGTIEEDLYTHMDNVDSSIVDRIVIDHFMDDIDEFSQSDASLPSINSTTPFAKGCIITSWQYDHYTKPVVDETLNQLQSIGCTWISIVTTWYQKQANDPMIASIDNQSPATPSREGIVDLISKIRRTGMTPILKPHVDILDESWRGFIEFDQAEDWQAWFDSYRNFIAFHADIAQEYQLKLLIIGTELKGTTHRDEWFDIIALVRSIFDGKIVYAANHDHYDAIPFWQDLDYIGIDGYFSLSDDYNPSLDQLIMVFNQITQTLQNFAQSEGKKIIFTEIGYQSYDGSNSTPWDAPTRIEDQSEQAHCYQAALQSLWNQEWLAGLYVWHTHYDQYDWDGFGVMNKEAEEVLATWYHTP
jgi:hypothetical protein